MSAYTNAVTIISNEDQYYVYPMAASLRGGAVESEYNIRNLMSCLFNKSATKSMDDFVLFYNKSINKKYPTLETYSENSSWYRVNTDLGYCEIYDIAVGPGEGNCNGYYTRLYEHTPLTSTSLNIQNLINGPIGYEPIQLADYREGDIEVVYAPESSEIDHYKVYKDVKYFQIDQNNNYVPIEVSEEVASGSDKNGPYTEVPGSKVIYKVSPAYAKFRVVLGLNWTINQLVSSVQVSIYEDSTIIETISESDSDNETITRNYTEFTKFNKVLQDRGLLDAGILLGTIAVKKTPLYSERNGHGSYSYKYTCTYTGNRYKTACIDLAKLGTDNDNLGINLYDKLNRVFSMMIDNGSLKIGTVINGSGFDENPESIKHDFLQGIAPYRLDLGLTKFTPNVSQNTVTGYLRIINYNEENDSYTAYASDGKSELGYMLKCDINVDASTGQPSGIKSLTLFNDGIQLHPNAMCIGSEDRPKDLYIYGNTTIAPGKVLKLGNVQISSDGTNIVIPNLKVAGTFSADTLSAKNATITNNLRTKQLNATQSINTPSLEIGNNILVSNNSVKIQADSLSIDSDAGIIEAPKVFGAVWQ